MELFITAHIMGGIGNQLFQISNALAQGWKNNIDVIFPTKISLEHEKGKFDSYKNTIYKDLKFVNNIPLVKEISEDKLTAEFKINEPIKFVGYFQDSKYFLNYNDKIREMFSPNKEIIEKFKLIYPEINEEKTLSLHIRRGDYLKISTHLPTIDTSYFNEAIKINGDYSHLFVFSDDKNWVKQNLKYPNMIVVDLKDTIEELWLMSLCKNNIISNSSFSWWGSWLNTNKNKKVFAPSLWLGPKTGRTYKKIYETNWQIINVKYNNGVLYKN